MVKEMPDKQGTNNRGSTVYASLPSTTQTKSIIHHAIFSQNGSPWPIDA